MAFELSVANRGAYLLLTPVGSMTEEALVDLGHAIRRTCDEAGVRGVVLDCQHIEGALPTQVIYYATQRYLEAVGLSTPVAYINPPEHWTRDQDQFSRDVAFNRGGSLEVFGTEAEAASWLIEKTGTDRSP